jgi:hypothetical protein
MARRLRWFVSLVVVVAVAACGGDSTSPSGPANIAGQWVVNLNFSNPQLAASCTAQNVVVNFTQTGSSFSGVAASGSQLCSIGASSQTFDLTGSSWTGGQITGSSVSFSSAGGCTIVGTLSGSPPNRMSGTLTCNLAVSGTNFVFTGNWSGSR